MATDLKRQRAEIANIISEWPYYCMEVKIYLVCLSALKRLRRNKFTRPIASLLITLYRVGDIIVTHINTKSESMPKAKRLFAILAALVLSASLIFIASKSWQLALVIGLVVGLPLGIWIGKQL